MVIPQFSIRLLILVTAVVAVLAMIASWGGQGIAWAIGATAALGMFVLAMLVQAALFGFIWMVSPLVGRVAPPESPARGEPILATHPAPPVQRPI